MRIGYSTWGFLGAGVLDTPDGSRAYRRPFIDELVRQGHQIILLQANRDLLEAGVDLSPAYVWEDGLPELDGLILEWRWPLPGRNTTRCGSIGHTCDLHRQHELVANYTAAGTPTLVWDLDRQLPHDAEVRRQPNVAVGEFSLLPACGAVHLPCPVPDDLLDGADPARLARKERSTPLVYVGNQYDRDDSLSRYFAPAAEVMPHRVAGKWPNTDPWPRITFTGRCRFDDVRVIHEDALATVLLLPERYARTGHVTSRWFEALLAGCLPLIPAEIHGAGHFGPHALLVSNGTDVVDKLSWLSLIAGTAEHAELIAAALPYLEPFRCSNQAARAASILKDLA